MPDHGEAELKKPESAPNQNPNPSTTNISAAGTSLLFSKMGG
jgi:hypothetical protein